MSSDGGLEEPLTKCCGSEMDDFGEFSRWVLLISEAQVAVPLMVDLGRHRRRAAAMGNWRFETAIEVWLLELATFFHYKGK